METGEGLERQRQQLMGSGPEQMNLSLVRLNRFQFICWQVLSIRNFREPYELIVCCNIHNFYTQLQVKERAQELRTQIAATIHELRANPGGISFERVLDKFSILNAQYDQLQREFRPQLRYHIAHPLQIDASLAACTQPFPWRCTSVSTTQWIRVFFLARSLQQLLPLLVKCVLPFVPSSPLCVLDIFPASMKISECADMSKT